MSLLEPDKNPNCAIIQKRMEAIKTTPHNVLNTFWNLGKEDPRRVIYAVKMGSALTIIALLYVLGPLYNQFGSNAVWAIMTVTLVLEFTVGATLYKGLNRGLGTFVAGILALLVVFLAKKTGHVCKIVIIGISVFVVGFCATLVRFIPHIKKNYDYGVIIFLLTFNLITISTYNMDNIFAMARDRSYTIVLGSAICLCMCTFILPNWSGQDLEKSMVNKFEALAKSIEACVNDYFVEISEEEMSSRFPIYKKYRTVLESKSSDESQALFASWEPRHSMRHYPWQQYVQLGTTLRHFAYTAAALHGCLESAIQAPQALRYQFKDPCIRLSNEVSKVLNQLAHGIKRHRRCPLNVLSSQLHEALQDLNYAIKSQPRLFLGPQLGQPEKPAALLNLRSRRVEDANISSTEFTDERKLRPQLSVVVINTLEFSDALPLAAFVSLLVEMVARLDLVIEEVEDLGKAAKFKRWSKKETKKKNVVYPGVLPEASSGYKIVE